MGFGVLGRLKRKFQEKKARAAGINLEKYQQYETAKKKELFKYEQKLKREKAEKELKEKYSRPSLAKRLSKSIKNRKPGTALFTGRVISKPELGLVSDPFEKSNDNPWTSDNKPKKKNPWLD